MNIDIDNLKRMEQVNHNTKDEIDRAAHIERKIRGLGYNFSHHPDAQKCYLWMAQYLRHYENKGPQPEKGLLIIGTIGSGKTAMAKLMAAICGIKYYTMREIDKAHGRSPDECENRYSEAFDTSSPVIIDDVGAEAGMRYYGNPPVLEGLMLDLYENWKQAGKLAIVTTNLRTIKSPNDPNTILNKMGPRIESRFHEMFSKVVFVGDDFRLKESEW